MRAFWLILALGALVLPIVGVVAADQWPDAPSLSAGNIIVSKVETVPASVAKNNKLESLKTLGANQIKQRLSDLAKLVNSIQSAKSIPDSTRLNLVTDLKSQVDGLSGDLVKLQSSSDLMTARQLVSDTYAQHHIYSLVLPQYSGRLVTEKLKSADKIIADKITELFSLKDLSSTDSNALKAFEYVGLATQHEQIASSSLLQATDIYEKLKTVDISTSKSLEQAKQLDQRASTELAQARSFTMKASASAKLIKKTASVPNNNLTTLQPVVVYGLVGFSPRQLTVKSGTTVIFKNQSLASVALVSDDYPDLTLANGLVAGGQYQLTFNKPGVYIYYDALDRAKTGQIKVE